MAAQPLVLIADNDASFIGALSWRLGAIGCRVEVAPNGDVMVQKAQALKPDLVLTEVSMPVKDGVTAVLEMKMDPAMKDLRVLFLTTLGDTRPGGLDVDQLAARQVGADGYIRKTDSLERIVARIRECLRA